jgi:L-ascorbate metabolism protein UlaG (beta-lactamase superfamily)
VGGDSGYDAQFKKIGETFGPFDLAFLECGQYGLNWPNIHMFPEQTVRAAMDLNVKVLFPVHWGKFALASHSWNESIQRLSAEANKQGQYFVMPLIGQPYHLGDTFEQDTWWL